MNINQNTVQEAIGAASVEVEDAPGGLAVIARFDDGSHVRVEIGHNLEELPDDPTDYAIEATREWKEG